MNKYYSNGKLLLTAEYLVLDGATALAVPTKFGQDLTVEPICEPIIEWKSYDVNNHCWFTVQFLPNSLKLISATFDSTTDGGNDTIAETLQGILKSAQELNPQFLTNNEQLLVQTHLGFPRDWGLGSSSTLINSIASWANVDAYQLLFKAFSGSAYDIACAQNNTPILYTLTQGKPTVKTIDFNPSFAEQLYFVHLNQKQNSREGIKTYRENAQGLSEAKKTINALTNAFVNAKTIDDLNRVINEHEQLITDLIKQQPIKNRLFNDYFGSVKSLGAWGGDFVLVTGDENTPSYFKNKGFETILRYNEMIL